MSELIDTAAPAPDAPGPSQSTETVTPAGSDRLSIREASRELSGYRERRDGTAEAPPTEAAPPGPNEEALQDAAEGEERAYHEQPDPANEPPVEAPRSWSKEEKERFQSLPRETQEYLNRRENERDTALRRGQNDTATLRQNLEAREQALQQQQQQYEQLLPALLQQYQEQQQGQFADIRTQADVDNMARNDWQRFAMWQAHQMKVQNVQQQMQANYQRSQQEYQTKWQQFATNEDNLFAQHATEMNDPEQAKDVAGKAVAYLRDTGFSDDDLNKLWSGQASVSLRDHRMQLMIRDAAIGRAAKAGVAAKKAAMPASRTLRPGTPAERASDAQVNLDSLSKQLDARDSGLAGVRNATELLMARRAARRR